MKLANAKKLFNLQYSTYLKNIIKCIFGIVKQQFQIFDKISKYLQATQIYIVDTTIGLYNFIKINSRNKKSIYFVLDNILNNT